jgi:hypothetical protein
MKTEQDRAWERWLDRELKQLPDLPAPAALVHRVMLAVHQRRSLPWYRRPWPAWPPSCQIFALLLFAGLAGFAITAVINPAWLPGWKGLTPHLEPWGETGRGLLAIGTTLLEAAVLLFQSVARHLFLVGLVLVLAGYLCAVAILSACYQLAFQRR